MILAWIGAILIGVTLGLLGSGGSILTVPVLTYLVGQETKVAIATSLMIVGIITLFAGIPYALQKQIKWRTVFVFGLPGILGAMTGAWGAHFVSDAVQMLIFSILLLMASYLMFEPIKLKEANHEHSERAMHQIIIDGFIAGTITGLVGVGGGFLIIPALVLLGGLSMRLAIGTSLIIVAMNSFAGFLGYITVLENLELALDWHVIIIFSILGILGSWAGKKLGNNIKQIHLKKGFAVFLILMGVFILYENVPHII